MMTDSENPMIIAMKNRPWLRYVILVVMALVALYALFTRLDEYPRPWYDEGSHLHVAKNYALNGIYADYSSEGNRPFGPAIGVGPTVLLPIAWLFKPLGVSIPTARLLIAFYGLLTLIAFYGLASRLLNFPSTVLAWLLLFLSPGVDFIFHSRTVLGEIPGLFFLCTALWLWLRPGTAGIVRLALVGLLMGLACVTKNQYALFILPALFVNWMADLFWYKKRGWMYFVIPGILAGLLFAGWTYITVIRLGEGTNFSENLATLRTASAGAFIVLSQASLERAVRFLLDSSVYAALFVPAFLYGLLLSLRRDEQGQRNGMVMIFIAVGSALFGLSLAWPRYAFAPLALAAIFAARLIFDFTIAWRFDWKSWRGVLRGEQVALPLIASLVVVGWVAIALIVPMYSQLHSVATHGAGDAYQIAEWLNANVPADATIETWEQELGVLTNHNYHYPPQVVLAYSVAEKWEGGPYASDLYDFRDYGTPDYLVVGTFDKYADIYTTDRIGDYECITSIGDYDVYQHLPPEAPRPGKGC